MIKYNVTSKFNVEDRVQLRVNIIFPKEDHSSLIVILCLYGSVFYENKDTDIGIYMFPIKDLLKSRVTQNIIIVKFYRDVIVKKEQLIVIS